jgi:serine/threonine protein kinase
MFTPSKTSRICRHLSIDLLSSVNDGENVAIKFLNCEKAVEKLRPRQEIELLCNLDHPNILRLVGAYEDSDLFIQVFEFLRQIKYLQMLKHDSL